MFDSSLSTLYSKYLVLLCTRMEESKLELDLSDTSDNEADAEDLGSSATWLSSCTSDIDTSDSQEENDVEGDDDSVNLNDVWTF